MKFYTIKLPKVLGSLVRAMLGAFKKRLILISMTPLKLREVLFFSKMGRPSING